MFDRLYHGLQINTVQVHFKRRYLDMALYGAMNIKKEQKIHMEDDEPVD
jgi:hypothetical protein